MCENLETLNIKHNNFGGKQPRSPVNCTSLEILDLGSKNITDTFPHWLEPVSSLRALILRANNFFGSISHPKVKYPFLKLQILNLSHNKLTGPLPAIYLQILTYMMEANVNNNPGQMGGTDKTKVNHLTTRAQVNILNGYKKTPDNTIGKYRYSPGFNIVLRSQGMLHLNCTSNQSGTVSRGTYYNGYIVVDVTMKGLEFEMKKILYVFTTTDISSNQFIGEIPPAIGMLKSLVVMNFSHNSFIGCIPSTLGNLTALESLDLSSNKLVGEIPPDLTSLTFLAILNLSHNQLKGHIPQGKQFDTFSNESDVGNWELCGSPLSNTCKSKGPPQVPSSAEVDIEEDSEGWFNWELASLMGYGCGLVLGLSAGYIIFTTGRPSRFVIFVERKQYEMLSRQMGMPSGRRV